MSEATPDRLDRIERILETLTTNQLSLQETVRQNTEEIHSLTDILMHSIQNAETDREVFQAEIRRIWEYLLGQQRNGNGSSGS
ncbi:hypothetical protein VF14_35070 [Nostoc linckia z18]|uniref:Uncharacterized protein n=2 Tax=Nostoc linckia TaxID=92942 RepID=A0A9Q5Z4N4_NOSLI|nr:hypothetical protein [Nostoc linckia]PHJ56374.1 hypothetical protein VF05_37300 [Nostoc linckia z3]PHJ56739.1 hypothetical protein VF03_37275 [Nostoc linckia z2]PHJ71229.1 hypothetical protein VF06_37315 [Nostoc linckia z4]PHJ75611.1 hypothetical protein VF07_37325 [Nostoc linckia z6]PHJ84981.1 hypothetical protein VF04_35925 [Nostoc linckia z7]